MKRIIDGKTYNTDTADLVCDLHCPYGVSDFQWHETALYRTKGGAFFLAGQGGPMSMWAQSAGQNSWSGGKGIKALSQREARELLESEQETDAIEEWFGEPPEATAADDAEKGREAFSLRLPPSLKAEAERKAREAGVSLNAYLINATKDAVGWL